MLSCRVERPESYEFEEEKESIDQLEEDFSMVITFDLNGYFELQTKTMNSYSKHCPNLYVALCAFHKKTLQQILALKRSRSLGRSVVLLNLIKKALNTGL